MALVKQATWLRLRVREGVAGRGLHLSRDMRDKGRGSTTCKEPVGQRYSRVTCCVKQADVG